MNAKRTHLSKFNRTAPNSQRQWWALPATFLATLLALPASAVDIPNAPLSSGGRVAPNVMFILDDSGSMTFVSMPKEIEDLDQYYGWGGTQKGLQDNPEDRSYLNNTIYYNPYISYVPWMNADGKTRWSGGMDVTKVYKSLVYASGTTESIVGKAGSIFYVPNAGVTNSTNPADFVRYRINNSGKVVARELARVAGFEKGPLDWTMDSSTQRTFTISVPSGRTELTVSTRGGGMGVDLYLLDPDGYQVCQSNSGNGAESCTATTPKNGNWEVRVYRDGSAKFTDVYLDAQFASEIEKIPPGTKRKTNDDELANIATWYSYHRTRMKTAKAGASEAFASPALNKKIRLGFRGINNTTNGSIPYTTGDGRFYDDSLNSVSNRTNWYASLQKANYGTGGTPLRTQLKSAGDYFKTDDPYKSPDSTGKSYVGRYCRQNFSILTTDGYWNDSNPGGIGDADGSDGVVFKNADGVNVGYVAKFPFKDDAQSITLADVAMKYWKEDLRSEDNNVPATDGDPAFWQHMVTFSISIGLKGVLDQSSVAEVFKDGLTKGGVSQAAWPTVGSNKRENIDDLLHAALNGHGEFVKAGNSTEFASGLAAALATITQRTSSYSNVSTNSVSLDAGSKVFNASYVSGLWTGKLVARSVSDAGVGAILWDTSDAAVGAIPAWSSRVVKTDSGSSLVSFPTSGQIKQLDRTKDKKGDALGPLDYPISGDENAKYIKGDQTNEGTSGGKLRVRTELLGDIVGSSPAYVKGGADGDGSVAGTLYVGANDGMLHAFNADNGKELFTYVPSILDMSKLRDISRGDYSHNWFVDGPLSVSGKSLVSGERVLVGTLGRGGTGIYALNVTSPSAPSFKWSLKDTSDGNMGLVLGKPILAKVGSGKTPAVVFGNGPNSSKYHAVLIGRKLSDGSKLFEIDTGEGTKAAPNGLSSVTGVYGADGQTLAYAYAGDLLGNVWKFDLTAETATKLFTASSGQAITGGVTIAVNPITSKRWVLFGTGKFMEDTDIEDTTVQSMYGFIDDIGTKDLKPSDLVNNTPSDWAAGTVDGKKVRAFKEKTKLSSTDKGWLVNLPAGERIVQDAQVVSTFLVTASMSPTGDACGSDGSGYINALDAFTGTSAGGSLFDLSTDTTTNAGGVAIPIGSVDLGYGMPTLPNLMRGLLVVGGTGGANVMSLKTLAPRWDRVSWREIRND